jgi:hypothetical protein
MGGLYLNGLKGRIVMRIVEMIVMSMVLAVAALGADVSGKWKAEFTTPDGTQRVNNFEFQQEGEKLTGTVAGTQDQTKIENGVVKGDEISFQAERPFGRFSYKGKISGDSIQFRVEFGDNGFEITAKRVN